MTEPRWRRRSADRHDEIADAAMALFAERGFAATPMNLIAGRAGLSKAAIYRYFPNKEALFRAVVTRAGVDVATLAEGIDARDPLALLPLLLARIAAALERQSLRQLALMVIGESGNFPELARIWREQVVEPALGMVTALIAHGQSTGSIRAGDSRLMAISVAGPMLMGAIWRQVVEPVGGAPIDLPALAAEHGRTIAQGFAATTSS